MNGQPFFDPDFHRLDCRCAWCSNRRDPTGRIGRTLVVAICLVLIAAGVVARLG